MEIAELGVIVFALVWTLMPLATLVLAVRIDRKLGRVMAALEGGGPRKED